MSCSMSIVLRCIQRAGKLLVSGAQEWQFLKMGGLLLCLMSHASFDCCCTKRSRCAGGAAILG